MTQDTLLRQTETLQAHAAGLRLKAADLVREADALDRLARRMRLNLPLETRPR